MHSVRVRGIYSTALSYILSEMGFRIVQPSDTIRERLGLEYLKESPEVDIVDTDGHNGIRVKGLENGVEKIQDTLRDVLYPSIFRRYPLYMNGIYKGVVKEIDYSKRAFFVDIGEEIGFLPFRSVDSVEELDVNQEVLVQVKEMPKGKMKAVLTTQLSIPGKYAVLISDGSVRVSKKIRDQSEIERLRKLGEVMKKNWGILWRTAAEGKEVSELVSELQELENEVTRMLKLAKEKEAPCLIRGDERVVEIEFTKESKEILDEIRRKVAPTVAGHHKYKSLERDLSPVVDFAERVLRRVPDIEREISEELRKVYWERITPGRNLVIEHVKLNGEVIHLGRFGKIIDVRENDVTIRREIRGQGIYDGISVPIEEGDYAETTFSEGAWYYRTKYYDKDGNLKGEYFNINTPIEISPWRVRYIDLEIDLARTADGEIEVLDEDKIVEYREKGFITDYIFKRALETVEYLKKRLRGDLHQGEGEESHRADT